MDHARFEEIISGRARGGRAALLRGALRAASWVYGAGVRARLRAYRIGFLRRQRVGIPVICVGNLSTGGTGKTPFVALVCERLIAMGKNPVIVSRGYRSTSGGGNDEARLLAELLPDIGHIQNPDRVAGAFEAKEHGADVAVLDDGFSHLRLARDFDILLFDALRPFGYDRLLPRGLLREPLSSARRAQLAVITRADLVDAAARQAIRGRLGELGFSNANIIEARHEPVVLMRVDDAGERLLLDVLSGANVALLSGIGNPAGFAATVRALGASVVSDTRLPDHFAYDDEWLRIERPRLIAQARDGGARYLLITQKDAVKLRGRVGKAPIPVLELKVRMAIPDGIQILDAALTSALRRGGTP